MRSPASLVCLVLALCASFCLTELSEVDLHWHLLAGQRILDEGHVPRTDDLSYVSSGRAWIDLIALVLRLAGWAGLDLLKIALIVGAFALSAAAARRRAPAPAVAAVALAAVVASQERFTMRPEAASFLMLGALLLLLERRRDRPRGLLLVPPLFALWANLHALYAVGLVLLGLVAVGDLIERRWPPSAIGGAGGAPRVGPLLVALCASGAATLLTPYGTAGWALPRRLLFERIAADNLYARSIAEFQAPFSGFGFTSSVGVFGLLALVTLGAALACPPRDRRPADLLVLAAFLALGLLARRNIPLFSLVALACGSPLVAGAARRAGEASARLGLAAAAPGRVALAATVLLAFATIGLMLDVVTNRFYARDATQRYFGRGQAPGFYPKGAADFILSWRPQGQVLNDMTMGGYLAWRWFPSRQIFIDGRLEVHDPSLFTAYLRMQRDPGFFEETARRYGITAVLWSHSEAPQAEPLLRHLASGHGWRPIYVDLAAAVYARDATRYGAGAIPATVDPDDPRLVQALEAELRRARGESAGLDPLPSSLRRLLPRVEVPVADVNAALFFAVLGRRTPAEELLRSALARAPGNATLHYDLGLVLDEGGTPARARSEYESALGLGGGFSPARSALALLMLRSGDANGALEQWRLAERAGPLPPAALEARGALLAGSGQLDAAIEDYRRLVRLEPGRGSARAALAILYHRNGQRGPALQEIERALADDPRAAAPRAALARIRAAEGDAAGAESIYRGALADDPACAEAHLGLAALLASSGRLDESVQEAARAVRLGLDPSVLSEEPALRILEGRADFRALRAGRPGTETEGERR